MVLAFITLACLCWREWKRSEKQVTFLLLTALNAFAAIYHWAIKLISSL